MKSVSPLLTLWALALLTSSRPVFAQQEPLPFLLPNLPGQPPETTITTPAAATEPDLSRKRDPFWPVSYVPRKAITAPRNDSNGLAVQEKARQTNWEAARKAMDIRGVSFIGRDKQSNAPKYIAMVGGKLTEEGDLVSVPFDGQLYRWKVTSINAAGISLVKMDVRPE
jgi:hypothetical protein